MVAPFCTRRAAAERWPPEIDTEKPADTMRLCEGARRTVCDQAQSLRAPPPSLRRRREIDWSPIARSDILHP
jgi:hypothetical protein